MKERMKKQWKKVKAKLPRLTRRGKLVRNLVCIVLLAGLCYLLLGAPPLTAGQAFRRAERQNLVGPSEILAAVSLRKLDVPETNRGEMDTPLFDREWAEMGFFTVGEQNDVLSYVWQYGDFTYFNQVEKTGDVTFFPFWTCTNEEQICEGGLVLLQTELEGAVRADIWIFDYSTRYYNYLWSQGTPVGDGVFVLPTALGAVPVETEYADRQENTARVTIYDEAGTVIYDKTWTEDEGGTYHES